MAVIDFPNPATQTPLNTFSPTSTPSATANGVTYTWDGSKWVAQVAGGGSQWTTTGSDIYYDTGKVLVGTSTSRNDFFNGTTTVAGGIQLELSAANNLNRFFSFTSNNSDTAGPCLLFGKSRGTTANSKTIVQNDDTIAQLSFQAADGSDMVEAARISAHIDGTPGANDMPSRLVFSTTSDSASSPTERMRITNSGTVLVGRTTNTSVNSGAALQPSNLAVEVASDTTGSWWNRTDSNAAWVAQRFYAQGSLSGFIQVNTSSVTYSTTSDYRLKENVVPLTGAVDRLSQLQVHRFNFIAEPDKTVDGFLAHEAQAIVPECVTGTKDEVDADGNPVYQGIDQSKLVPLLTAALQEALTEIEDLKTRLTALEAN